MLSVSNVSMRYGAKVLFDEVSTAFTPGKRYGLTGPNGAGKSTFMKILTGESDIEIAVPRDAIIYEGDTVRVWVVRDDNKAIELRRIKVGLTSGNMVEVTDGLAKGERVVTKGSLFIDRVATAES